LTIKDTADTSEDAARSEMVLVLNWAEELKHLAPGKN